MELFPPFGSIIPDGYNSEMQRLWFLNQLGSDALTMRADKIIDISVLDILKYFREVIKTLDPDIAKITVQSFTMQSYMIMAEDYLGNRRLQVQIECGYNTVTEARKTTFMMHVTGSPEFAIAIIARINKDHPDQLQDARVRWYYHADGKLTYTDIILDKPEGVRPEYYPYLEPPTSLFENFLNSSAPILFLSGSPGTGKTTLLRNFLFDYRLRAVVTYEDVLLNSDVMFVDFIASSANHDVMIIEDADVMLTARIKTGNKLIARFLNASEGLIKIKRKKIIFTTNMSNFNDVDDALIRPGRCFATLQFRSLSIDEANKAARVAEIKNWQSPDKEVTLAEIFHQGTQNWLENKVGY